MTHTHTHTHYVIEREICVCVCVCVCVRTLRRRISTGTNVMEDTLMLFEPLLFSFTSTQPSMDTLGEQQDTMSYVLVVDVII